MAQGTVDRTNVAKKTGYDGEGIGINYEIRERREREKKERINDYCT